MLTLLHSLTLAIGCGVHPAWCTCLPPREPRTPVEARQYIERAEMAFVATVLRIENPVASSGGVLERVASDDPRFPVTHGNARVRAPARCSEAGALGTTRSGDTRPSRSVIFLECA